jgi:hypothetical protein
MAYPVASITLNQNIITAALFNMLISQQVFDSRVASTELADRFRVDGTLFGDTKLYHSFDIGNPEDWLNDAESANLLSLNRNKSGKTQTVTMGVYKMISITIDQYLSKQAFMHDGTFSEYTSFLTGSLRKIKRVYDRSLINVQIGTLEPSTDRCDITITTPLGNTVEETNRLEAQTIAAELVVLKADLEDNNRDFNKLGYLRSYPADELIAVWNVKKHAKITKLDLPTIFHKDINVKGGFKEYDLPAKWFGKAATSDLTLESSAPVGEAVNRVLVSGWYDVTKTKAVLGTKPTEDSVYLYAGDVVPYTGQEYVDAVRGITVTVTSTTFAKEHYYVVDDTIAFMLVHSSALPFMSGFETGTEFWNARSLTTNHYLIFGHNNLEFIEEYPRIRVKVVQEQASGDSGDN